MNEDNYDVYEGTDNIVSMWTWVGLYFLIGLIGLIPYIGTIIDLVILIIMACIDINKSLKNWARAMLFLLVIILLYLFIFVGWYYFSY